MRQRCADSLLPVLLVSYRSLACIDPVSYSRRRHARAHRPAAQIAAHLGARAWTVTQQRALRDNFEAHPAAPGPTVQRHATNVTQGRTALQQRPVAPPQGLPQQLHQAPPNMGRGDAPTLEVVDEYDADGDGRVTREEYLAGFLRGIDQCIESWPHAHDAARRRIDSRTC